MVSDLIHLTGLVIIIPPWLLRQVTPSRSRSSIRTEIGGSTTRLQIYRRVTSRWFFLSWCSSKQSVSLLSSGTVHFPNFLPPRLKSNHTHRNPSHCTTVAIGLSRGRHQWLFHFKRCSYGQHRQRRQTLFSPRTFLPSGQWGAGRATQVSDFVLYNPAHVAEISFSTHFRSTAFLAAHPKFLLNRHFILGRHLLRIV